MTMDERNALQSERRQTLLALTLLWSAADHGVHMDPAETHHVQKVMATLKQELNQ